jgi:hypothetical protein
MSLYFILMSYLSFFVTFLLVALSLVQPVSADDKPVINEFLPHPSSGNKEWVELAIPDGLDVTGYWIDDDTDFTSDTGSSAKKQITSVIPGSDSNHVVFELSSSIFNNDGDIIALFSPDGNLLDQYTYTKDPGEDISIGRTPDITGDFTVLASVTKGGPNSSAQPTVTPTPSPTDKPTKAPNPTDTPKPAKTTSSSNSTKITSASNTKIPTTATTSIVFRGSLVSKGKISSTSPTSILGASTTAEEKKPTSVPRKTVLVKAASNSLPQVIAICIGGVLFLSCGILMYLKKKGKLPF